MMETLYRSRTYSIVCRAPGCVEIESSGAVCARLTGEDVDGLLEALRYCADGAEDELCATVIADPQWRVEPTNG